MIAASLVLALGISTVADGLGSARVVTGQQAPVEFLIVPIRAHILTSPDLELANCKLRESDITRVVRKVNAIWSQAGIAFGVESIVREPAAQRDRFRLVVELSQGQLDLADLDLLLPKSSRVVDGLNVYFFHDLPFNGSYLGGDCVLVQEGARLNEVAGGSDEPMARVLGHCAGRALNLAPRREPETSLMALGTTGFALDADEVGRARRVAKTIPGVLTVAEARKAADAAQAAGDATKAKLLRSWLDAVASTKAADAPRTKPSQNRPPDKQKRRSGRELTSRS
ncbi:MAG: Matrixin [Isosphaeraceae bacterium]